MDTRDCIVNKIGKTVVRKAEANSNRLTNWTKILVRFCDKGAKVRKPNWKPFWGF